MISGIAIAAKALNPSIKIIAAEPTGTNGQVSTLSFPLPFPLPFHYPCHCLSAAFLPPFLVFPLHFPCLSLPVTAFH